MSLRGQSDRPYVPEQAPLIAAPEMLVWLTREFQNIANALNTLDDKLRDIDERLKALEGP